ncbi:hypothetical protein TDB9533_00929 [Thalassocella blandensis]|nr:hypothetical protein TDB9533_00929 [Thalassocella blandensis]
MANIIVFSLGACGYHWEYAKNIASHRRYCEKHGYQYILIDTPKFTWLGMEIVWLKILYLQHFLAFDVDWVMCIDADAEIKECCPPLTEIQAPEKSIYMAKGYSGRYNSGVLIVRNTIESQQFFSTILSNRHCTLPTDDDVGWGENGHIIHFAKGKTFVQAICRKWNNNHDPEMKDYIRHYSAGPIRHLYTPARMDHLKFKLLNVFSKLTLRVVLPALRFSFCKSKCDVLFQLETYVSPTLLNSLKKRY